MRTLRILLIVLLVSFMIPGITLSQEGDAFTDAFNEAGADFESADMVDWSVINREFLDFETMEDLRDKLIDYFDANGQNFTTTKEFDDMYRIIISKGWLDSDTFLQLILQTVELPEEYGKDPQTYLVINVMIKNISDVTAIQTKMRDAITEFGGKSRITTCLTGSFNGKLDEVKKQEILEAILRKLQVSCKEKVNDRYTLSFMGYSPLLQDSINICGKDYNLNIALRYNSEVDKTYLWMGTPVISLEY